MNSKNAILATLLLFFITLEVLIGLDYVAKQKDLTQKRVLIFEGIIELKSEIGYLGLIHNFKNAILRPNELHYLKNAIENHRLAVIQLELIETQGALFFGELKMNSTRAMLMAYKERLLLLPELLDKNMETFEIDNLLRYDDEPSNIEMKLIFDEIITSLEAPLSALRNRSLKIGFFVLLALTLTFIVIIRFFFKEQQQALEQSNRSNAEMEMHKTEMARSQKVLLSMMQDVEKEKAQATTLNEQLTNKNKEMEQFIYTVSHDLKSPLVTITSYTQKLKSELVDILTEKQAYRLDRITLNVANMEALLTDLLDLSRIVQQGISTTEVNVKDVVEHESGVLEGVISEASATVNIAEHLHTVNANERLLREGILNLLSNAIRYREPSTPLVINISTTQTALSTVVHVKDNGIGIDPKYHELVFAIFEKLSPTTGTGVGLTIVKTIMDKHNGQVSLDSKLGGGCCFSLEFPNATKD